MTYCQDAWLGAWENFENYFTDESPAMMQSWVDAEASIKENKKSLLSAFLFRRGGKGTGRAYQPPAFPICLRPGTAAEEKRPSAGHPLVCHHVRWGCYPAAALQHRPRHA